MLKDFFAGIALFFSSVLGISDAQTGVLDAPPADPPAVNIMAPEAAPATTTVTTYITQPVIERIVQQSPAVASNAPTRAELQAAIAALRSEFNSRSVSGVSATFLSLQVDRIYDSVERGLSGTQTSFAERIANLSVADIPDLSEVYLPLTGGSLTGSLSGTDLTLSGTLTASALTVAAIASAGAVQAPYFVATSTLATTTLSGALSVVGPVNLATTTIAGGLVISGVATFANGQTFSSDHQQNLFLGFGTGANNTVTGVGTEGRRNIAFGHQALTANTIGAQNNAFGSRSLSSNTTGTANNAFGAFALEVNTTGTNNNAFGHEALRNTTASANSAFGYFALNGNSSGASNTAMGFQAMVNNTTGSQNTAVGRQAGSGAGSASGSNNLFLGYRAGDNVSSGSNNVIIGYDIDIPGGGTASNRLTIGNLIFGTGLDGSGTSVSSGNVGIGTTTPWRTLSVAGTVGFDGLGSTGGTQTLCLTANKEVVTNNGECVSSSESLKEDIQTISLSATDMVSAMRPVSFKYLDADRPTYGFIAEDVASIDSHFIGYFDQSGSPRTINTASILAVTVKAVQELANKIAALFSTTQRHDAELQQLRARVSELEDRAQIATPPPYPPSLPADAEAVDEAEGEDVEGEAEPTAVAVPSVPLSEDQSSPLVE